MPPSRTCSEPGSTPRPLPFLCPKRAERLAWLVRRSKVHGRSFLEDRGVWRIRGPLHGTDRPLSLLVAGPETFAKAVAYLFLAELERTERVSAGLVAEGSLDRAGHDDDVVAELRWPWTRVRRGELEMAVSLDARIATDVTAEQHVARLADSHRQAWARRETIGVTFSCSNRPEDLRLWYHRLHEPLLRHRHGHHAYVPPLESFADRRADTVVQLARRGDEILAGQLLEHDPWFATLTCTAVGARPEVADDGKLYKILTVAMDQDAFERAQARRIPWFSFGYTAARVNNGMFGYKRRWGASFVPWAWSLPAVLRLRPQRACEILQQSPLVTQPRGKTVVRLGAASDDATALEALASRIKMATFANLDALEVHTSPACARRVRAAVEGLGGQRVGVEVVEIA